MKDILKNSYRTLFEKHADLLYRFQLHQRGFVFQYDEDECECDVLFVGINPSYTEKEDGKIYEDSYGRNTDRSYFSVFQAIHEELKHDLAELQYSNWTHIDWFVFRETDQKQVKNLMNDPDGAVFLWDQLQIAKERLIRISPRIMVVSNALAREFTGKNKGGTEGNEWGVWMGLQFVFDEEYGSWCIQNIPELAQTHVLFSSMLSGQRALDVGSRERLVWQMRRILRAQN